MTKKPTPAQWRQSFEITYHMGALQCSTCRHLEMGGRCTAYPQGIPHAIFTEQVSHKEPQPGDNGIRWEPAPAEWTDGPVRFSRIQQTTDLANGWDIVGAICIGVDDFSEGWQPRDRYMMTGESMKWITFLRDFWRAGATPEHALSEVQRRSNGLTMEAMVEERAASLEDLICLLA